MPPSGFNRSCVEGALALVNSFYEELLEEVASGQFSSDEDAVQAHLDKTAVVLAANLGPKSVVGVYKFINGCYVELLQEVQSGKHANLRAAVEYELGQIEKVLLSIHIDDKGSLAERPSEEYDRTGMP